MKPVLRFALLVPSLIFAVFGPSRPAAAAATNRFEIVQRGQDFALYQRVSYSTNRGQAFARTNSYKALQTSKHHWVHGGWQESREDIQIVPGGAVATNLPHKVGFAANLRSPAPVAVITPSGQTLRIRPLGLAYYDFHSEEQVLIASLKDCPGQLVATNQVLYPDCFSNLLCSIRYTVKKAGVEQDVILRQRPPLPETFGFNPKTTRLLMLTEFINPPGNVQTVSHVRRGWRDATVDKVIKIGGMSIAPGTAFSLGLDENRRAGVPVQKQWAVLSGRTFLIEEVPFPRAVRHLRNLQASVEPAPAGRTPARQLASKDLVLPAVEIAALSAPARLDASTLLTIAAAQTVGPSSLQPSNASTLPSIQVASVPPSAQGFVLDADLVTSTSGVSLLEGGDITYLVDGTVNVDSLVIEGGAVVKYNPGASLNVLNSVQCLTGPYRPAIFTAVDDNTVGESIGSGSPSGTYAACAISLATGGDLKHVNIRYAADGIYCANAPYSVSHAQFVSCSCALHSEYADFSAQNLLAYQVGACFYGSYFHGCVEHLTCDQAGALTDDWDFVYAIDCPISPASSSLMLVNSITAALGGGYGIVPITTNHVQDYADGAAVFQGSGAGTHYLLDGPARNAGTTEVQGDLLATFAHKTTSPPVALETGGAVTNRLALSPRPEVRRYTGGAPDLGYYYDALDYTVQNLYCEGAAITVAPGTAIGIRNDTSTDPFYTWPAGFVLWENSSFVSHGTPDNPNFFTDVRMVQEVPSGWPAAIAFVPDFVVQDYELWEYERLCFDLPPLLSFRFSTFSFPPEDILLASGFWTPNGQYLPLPTRGVNDSDTFILDQNSSMHWSFQDCALHGGQILVGLPYRSGRTTFPAGSLSWINTSFDRVRALIHPTAYPPCLDMDWHFQAYNNLFRGGILGLWPAPSSGGDWVIKDNLFDSVDLQQYDPSPDPLTTVDHGYNAYYQTTGLQTNSNSGTNSTHDQILTDTPAYETSICGDYYLNIQSPLYNQLHATGSRTCAQAGLNHFTSWSDQTCDASDAPVNIGLHYVAAINGAPISMFLYEDGLPDYIADADGNAELDSAQSRPPPTHTMPITQANNDIFVVNQGESLLPVLTNDTCSQGFPLTIFFPVSAVPTHHGTVRLADDGTNLLYTPNPSFSGWDNATYAIVNSFNQEFSAAVSIYVNPAGIPPAAPDLSFTINWADGFTDCTLCTGPGLQVAAIGTPHLGGAYILHPSNPGAIRYTRYTSVAGSDTFRYVVTDSTGHSAMGNVTITRNLLGHHPPVAHSYSTSALRNQPLQLTLPAESPDNHALVYVYSQPTHGHIEGSGPAVTYTANAGYMGMDGFCYYVFDGFLSSPQAAISIKVQAGNNPPQAYDYAYQTSVHTPVPVSLYAWDPDDDRLIYDITTPPAHGSLSGTAPNLTYTPEDGYEGDDSFVFSVRDGKPLSSSSATVRLKVVRQQIVALSSPQENFTFKGNITYYLQDPVALNGTTTIEGGAVVKFRWHWNNAEHRARLTFNGPIVCLTTPYHPAIFTAADDDSVGAALPESGGTPVQSGDGAYADVALEVANTSGSDLKYLRIAWANTAIRYTGAITSPPADTLRHLQIFRCHTAFDIEGNAEASPTVNRELTLQNCLVTATWQVFTGSVWHAQAEHLTIGYLCNTLAPDPATHTFTLALTNSVFAGINSFGGGQDTTPPCITGDYNGFLSDPSGLHGSHEFFDASPFAPNPASYPAHMANCFAAYYLRDGSPFIGVGTPDITPSLKTDLAQMTTTVPELFTTDVASSQTLGPTIPRGTDVPTLGYHYPVIDYVLNGATVNNCTLNIDQGTVLAYTGLQYEWGLRLNPGARLNVNGYPTNRVTFARLAAVQENPQALWQEQTGPLITFKGVFLPSGTMVTPLPEARLHYADFPALAGNAVHFGPLAAGEDQTYDCLGALAFDGCHFQGGTFGYESGGPAGRTLSFRNTIFERSFVELRDHGAPHGNSAEELNAANNLFYDCDMWLVPASTGGNGWAFRDNIFDNSVFNGAGPAAINTHNAYVNMTGHHLFGTESGAVDSGTLDYQPGPLGRFYLPATATALLGGGSRTAAAAGLYHFTSLVNNTKEADGQVNIGPSYVAVANEGRATLVNNGDVTMDFKITSTPNPTGPGDIPLAAGASTTITPDAYISVWPSGGSGSPQVSEAIPHSTSFTGRITWQDDALSILDTTAILRPADFSHDGIPDFIADRNGDGSEGADESPWTSDNSGSLELVPPSGTISGIVPLRVKLGPDASSGPSLIATTGGNPFPDAPAVLSPATSSAEVDIDTRLLANGESQIRLSSYNPCSGDDTDAGIMTVSTVATITTANTFCFPTWQSTADELVNISLQSPPSLPEYSLWFFNSLYPKDYDPSPISHHFGVSVGGAITYSETPENLGYGNPAADPVIYSCTEAAASGSPGAATASPNPAIERLQSASVGEGDWVVAFGNDPTEQSFRPAAPPPLDWKAQMRYVFDPETLGFRWAHGWKLTLGWYGCGFEAGAETFTTLGDGVHAQTWPLRAKTHSKEMCLADRKELKRLLSFPTASNFYGAGHGDVGIFLNIRAAEFKKAVGGRRFRFAFLDGCLTGSGNSLLQAFGANPLELGCSKTPSEMSVPVHEPLDDDFYDAHPKLPRAAYLGYLRTSTSIRSLPIGQSIPDPYHGNRLCTWNCYEAMCNWHDMFLFYWRECGWDLVAALKQAGYLTMTAGRDNPPYISTFLAQTADEDFLQGIPFQPDTCLRVVGYGRLKFKP